MFWSMSRTGYDVLITSPKLTETEKGKEFSSRFSIRLPVTLSFPSDNFKCSLIESYIGLNSMKKLFLIFIECENLISGSIINDQIRPILGVYPALGKKFSGLYSSSVSNFKKIKISRVNFLTFNIVDQAGTPVLFEDKREVFMRIHFREIS